MDKASVFTHTDNQYLYSHNTLIATHIKREHGYELTILKETLNAYETLQVEEWVRQLKIEPDVYQDALKTSKERLNKPLRSEENECK